MYIFLYMYTEGVKKNPRSAMFCTKFFKFLVASVFRYKNIEMGQKKQL